MSKEKRSRVMKRIRSKNTEPERIVVALLQQQDLYFEQHSADLPGRPDIVIRHLRIAIFIDGDFWHGWRFPLWQHKLSKRWKEKIAATRKRDQRNFSKLRHAGWKVLRIWEHQIEQSPEESVEKILLAYSECLKLRTNAAF